MIKSAFVKAIAASSKLLPVSLKGYFRRTYSGQRLVDWLGLDTPDPFTYEPAVCYAIERLVQPDWFCVDVGGHKGLIAALICLNWWGPREP